MPRHIYSLIVDCPERANSVAHAVSALADTLLAAAETTRTVTTEVIVPASGLQPAMRPRVILEVVRRESATDPG